MALRPLKESHTATYLEQEEGLPDDLVTKWKAMMKRAQKRCLKDVTAMDIFDVQEEEGGECCHVMQKISLNNVL